jgi:hypothetical protein
MVEQRLRFPSEPGGRTMKGISPKGIDVVDGEFGEVFLQS